MTIEGSSNWETIKALVNPHFLKEFGISSAKDVGAIRPAHAEQLLSPLRFDIFAKYIYAEFRDKGLDSTWGRDVYIQHLKAFNQFDEGDGSGKAGIDVFMNTFHEILDSIRDEGFIATKSLVPVTKSNVVIDGSHRVAAAAYYNKNVTVAEINAPGFVFDYGFFAKQGMPAQYMDAVGLEFCRLKPNAYVALVFPSAAGRHDLVKKILNTHGRIFYEKQVFLNQTGSVNLIRQIYSNEHWLGDERDNFAGARNKASACFARKQTLRVFIYSADSLEDVNKAKAQIRDLFKISNHSIHINDSHDEAIAIAQLLMNDNSIHFLNTARISPLAKFTQHFESFRHWLGSNNLPSDSFCVDGSAVLGAYGIREPADLDFIHHGYDGIKTNMPNVSSHNDESHYHQSTIDDLIFNPQNHFYCNGIKFVSLPALQKMKTKRWEKKDKKDVRMIERALRSNKEIMLVMRMHDVVRNVRRVNRNLRRNAEKIMTSVKCAKS